ncbi:hypothetical protein D0T49_11315 [Paludibacter sp. 221]|uniref:glycoside hydrolase family 10 protein n=1 Tax=Paludibacter sp. 221 TaxID=2302939 RepID=UPI0013D83683|nr:family 10 glycosylhydrolase [Paludibacter sp. 221]NDV47636.1 hypothetical protein [Paludibacter sp. 221]
MHKRLTFLFLLISITSIYAQHPKRELRGVWIATVNNIDWPSRQWLSTDEQKQEMIAMLDKFKQNNINAVIFQVRPTADALYFSKYEPWSHWLTGKQGVRPSPYYDPLEFLIQEAHKRFMEVHVWLNPYRVTNNDNCELLHKDHLFFKNNDLFVKYGNCYYFDPGLDATREYLNLVVKDIVERYDMDAIHFDDYFYPYKINGEDFPDQKTFENNSRGFKPGQKADWRRNNVDMIISELQYTIKSVKPWVEFGVSPFGVWRNSTSDRRGSATKAGIQNYDDLYADILKWLREGYIDYVMPQLYWEIGRSDANYDILLKWWSRNSYRKNLYIGLAAYKSGDASHPAAWSNGNELIRQIKLNRKNAEVDGAAFYNASNFLSNKMGLNDSLQNNYYKYPALCPVNRNIQGKPAMQPQNINILKDGDNTFIVWDKIDEKGGDEVMCYMVYAFKGKHIGDLDNPANILLQTKNNYLNLKDVSGWDLSGNYTFVVTSVNRYKHESVPTHAVTRKL